MKILALGDNHGDEFFMNEIYSLYSEEVMLWIHCGDSEFDEFNPHWNAFTTVRGNMDITDEFPVEKSGHFKDVRFALAHGHLHNVKNSLDKLKEFAIEENADFAFYGHTHVPKIDYEDGIYFINPGSLTQPRGGRSIGSYVVIESENREGKITFYDTNHNKIDYLSHDFSLNEAGTKVSI